MLTAYIAMSCYVWWILCPFWWSLELTWECDAYDACDAYFEYSEDEKRTQGLQRDCQNGCRNKKVGDRRTPYSLGSTRSKYQPNIVNLGWRGLRHGDALLLHLQTKGRTISRHIMAKTDIKEQFLTLVMKHPETPNVRRPMILPSS